MAGTEVRVNQAEIRNLFGPTGQVGKKMGRVASRALMFARIEAPHRTGDLAASLSLGSAGGYFYTYGGLGNRVELRSSAPYAEYVEWGVAQPIYPTHGEFLSVPRYRGTTRPRMGRRSVAGQRENGFMRRSMEQACLSEGLVVRLF